VRLPRAAWWTASLLPPGCGVKPTIRVFGHYGVLHLSPNTQCDLVPAARIKEAKGGRAHRPRQGGGLKDQGVGISERQSGLVSPIFDEEPEPCGGTRPQV
jgi:hypothetical protein